MRRSDPSVEQYIEVQFPGSSDIYLRYCDNSCSPNWNLIGILWYGMTQGSWEVLGQDRQKLEERYQACLKQS